MSSKVTVSIGPSLTIIDVFGIMPFLNDILMTSTPVCRKTLITEPGRHNRVSIACIMTCYCLSRCTHWILPPCEEKSCLAVPCRTWVVFRDLLPPLDLSRVPPSQRRDIPDDVARRKYETSLVKMTASRNLSDASVADLRRCINLLFSVEPLPCLWPRTLAHLCSAELVDIKDTKVQVVPVAPPVPVHLCEYEIGDIVLVHPGETELQRFWVAEVVDIARERDGLLQVRWYR